MASPGKRNGKWQALVRHVGYDPHSQSFHNRTDAQRWIRQTKIKFDQRALAFDPATVKMTVAGLLTRERHEVTPQQSGHPNEAKRIEVFRREKGLGSDVP